jgi:hypothetical protein
MRHPVQGVCEMPPFFETQSTTCPPARCHAYFQVIKGKSIECHVACQMKQAGNGNVRFCDWSVFGWLGRIRLLGQRYVCMYGPASSPSHMILPNLTNNCTAKLLHAAKGSECIPKLNTPLSFRPPSDPRCASNGNVLTKFGCS